MERFHQLFLADGAPYSLERYQREEIGDKDIELAGWDAGDDGVLTRSMSFIHPVKNSFGVGPPEVRTTKQQRLKRYHHFGLYMENTTVVEGVPSADAFYVQDNWIVEAVNEDEVVLTVRFGTRFTKRALFKGLIEKNILKETTDWFKGYADMVQKASVTKREETRISVVQRQPIQQPAPSQSLDIVTNLLQRIAQRIDKSSMTIIGMFAILIAILCLQLLTMFQAMSLLQTELGGLKAELRLVTETLANQTAMTPQG